MDFFTSVLSSLHTLPTCTCSPKSKVPAERPYSHFTGVIRKPSSRIALHARRVTMTSSPPPRLPQAGVALGFKLRGRGWPLKQPEIKQKIGVKMQTLRIITRSGVSQSSKRGGHKWLPKVARNPKFGVIFAKCAPMTPCPLLAQPLATGKRPKG